MRNNVKLHASTLVFNCMRIHIPPIYPSSKQFFLSFLLAIEMSYLTLYKCHHHHHHHHRSSVDGIEETVVAEWDIQTSHEKKEKISRDSSRCAWPETHPLDDSGEGMFFLIRLNVDLHWFFNLSLHKKEVDEKRKKINQTGIK